MNFFKRYSLRQLTTAGFLFSIAWSFATHFIVATRHQWGLQLPIVKVLSDFAFLGLLVALVGYIAAFIWTLVRERKFSVLYLAYFLFTFAISVYFAFFWSLETEGFRP